MATPANPVLPPNGFTPAPALPQVTDPARPCVEHQYAAKLVTGIPGKDNQGIVAPGTYFTAINVHNPSTCKTVTFRWKVAVARPAGQPFGVITRFQTITLRPDQAVEIDSPNVARALGLGPTVFVKGYVVLESPCELDVVAVYTAGAPTPTGQAGNVAVFDTERVPARRIAACHDLNQDLSTGLTEWTLVSAVSLNGAQLPGIVTPRPADLVAAASIPSTWLNQWPAAWISSDPTGGNTAGFYTFQRCFSLCSSFDSARIDLHFLADNTAAVWLNGNQVLSFTGSFTSTTPLSIVNQSWFLPGLNCLSFVVRNNEAAMGLNVLARISAVRGGCADGCGCGGGCGCSSDEGAKLVYPPVHPPDPNPVDPTAQDNLPG